MTNSVFTAFPLCECLSKVQNKFVAIRNAAMAEDRIHNPGISFLHAKHDFYDEACSMNLADYLIEIVSLKHDDNCSAYNEVVRALSDTKKYYMTLRMDLSPEDFNAKIQSERSQYVDQMLKTEEAIKKFTAHLNNVNTSAYWVYLTSKEHSKLLGALSKDLNDPTVNAVGQGLSLKHIALIHFFEGKTISAKNAAQIAHEHGFTAPTSGESLRQDFMLFQQKRQRLGLEYSKRKLKFRIRQFETVLQHLTANARTTASSELNELNEILEKKD